LITSQGVYDYDQQAQEEKELHQGSPLLPNSGC
jgi:hypothetical protein